MLDDPNQLAPNLNSYLNGFSPNVRDIMQRFGFDAQIAKMAEKDLLFLVIQKFAAIDLSPGRVDNAQMAYVFEELIRIGAEQSNEEAGEHFTQREAIKLMVNLLLSPEKDLARNHVVKTIRLPQDHRRTPAVAELPGQRRTNRPARGRERFQKPRRQRQERPRRPPAGDRGWPAAAGANPRTAPRLRQGHQGITLQRP
ncbi:MAG: hypothetical protein NTW21_26885 [Verrucomicrobia bacterium]|nr:hypothetical protein [Verrucomicrobiota bacterium]